MSCVSHIVTHYHLLSSLHYHIQVVGLGLFGVSLFFYLMTINRDTITEMAGLTNPGTLIAAVDSLASFGFGASSIALFARVAGGIYTKVRE